ncbi:MAG: hypothetical protein LBT44_04705 [Clostridiales bacterium]|jgi:cell division protein FtsL|nr:hypothetical protein [Clostridiales bacterium]
MADRFGNTARAYDFAASPDGINEREQGAEKRKRRLIRRKVRVKPVFVYEDDRAHRISALNVITLLVITAGLLCVAVSASGARRAKAENAQLSAQIRAENEIVADLREEVNRTVDIEKIREIAVTKLGMSEPEPYQIIHMQTPEESYAVGSRDAQTSPAPPHTNIFAWVRGFWGGKG